MFYHTGSIKDYQLHFLLFGVEFISVSCYENIENKLYYRKYILHLLILLNFRDVLMEYN